MIVLGWVVLFSNSSEAAKRALIYNGPGACSDGCYQAAYQVALQAGLDPVYVGENALTAASSPEDRDHLFKDAVLWLQPGGKSRISMTSMTSALKEAIDQFIKIGGGYVGFCAGAFSSTRIVGTSAIPGLGLMPGSTVVYPDRKTADIIPIAWNGKKRNLYWEGGPYLTAIPPGKAEMIATYPNGSIAAARSVYGKGRVFVTGLHPEAPQDWRDYYHLKDKDGLDQDLAVEMIHWVIDR